MSACEDDDGGDMPADTTMSATRPARPPTTDQSSGSTSTFEVHGTATATLGKESDTTTVELTVDF